MTKAIPDDSTHDIGDKMTEKAEPTEGQVRAKKAIKTAKTATTLAKAHLARESNKHGGRWQWVEFLGANGRESAGIVDIVAIRKRWDLQPGPEFEKLKHLDLFDIMLIQVKGGSAPNPTADDITRLERVADHYKACNVLLYQWNEKDKKATGFRVLNRETHQFGELVTDGSTVFGKILGG
ncbi:MAG: hypothetical protein ACM3Q3_09940 [Nitrospirota bacterium]